MCVSLSTRHSWHPTVVHLVVSIFRIDSTGRGPGLHVHLVSPALPRGSGTEVTLLCSWNSKGGVVFRLLRTTAQITVQHIFIVVIGLMSL